MDYRNPPDRTYTEDAHITARTTGPIFSIIIDHWVERVKGGRMDRVSVTVCRYDNDKAHNHNWTRRHYGRNVTKATRARLMWAAPLAQENRRIDRIPAREMFPVLGAVASVDGGT